jgi:uncharacterized protein DUF5985
VNESVRIWMQGAIAMGYLVVMLFFINYYRQTHQRIFFFFSAGFGVLAVHRTMFALTAVDMASFSLRLLGYLLILVGILAQGWRIARE